MEQDGKGECAERETRERRVERSVERKDEKPEDALWLAEVRETQGERELDSGGQASEATQDGAGRRGFLRRLCGIEAGLFGVDQRNGGFVEVRSLDGVVLFGYRWMYA